MSICSIIPAQLEIRPNNLVNYSFITAVLPGSPVGLLVGSITVIVIVMVPCTLSAGVLLPSAFVNSSGLVSMV